jgi:hypothetical protein
MDGFGVAWWSDTYEEFESGSAGKAGLRPVVYKNVRPPLNDLILQNLARGVSSNAVVAHIRAGTGVFVFVSLSMIYVAMARIPAELARLDARRADQLPSVHVWPARVLP